MSDSPQTMHEIRELARRGRYNAVVEAINALPLELRRCPEAVTEKVRALLRQGNPAQAEAALADIRLDEMLPGERLILSMEAAALRVYRYAAIREALEKARALLSIANSAEIDLADLADAERVQIRIMLIAATYYEISAEEADAALARLPILADILQTADRLDEALAARFTWAERQKPATAQIYALTELAEQAARLDRPNLAAEAYTTVAALLLSGEGRDEDIQAILQKAEAGYALGRHAHGTIDIQKLRDEQAIARGDADLKQLEKCVEAYAEVNFPRGQINVLMDLAQLAHTQGDTRLAAQYRQQFLELSQAAGMGLVRDSFITGQVDLLMRSGDYGAAIELCHAAIAANPPVMNRAGYEQLMATAYFFVNDLASALVHNRAAVNMFEAAGAVDSASNSVLAMANNLASLRSTYAWEEAEASLWEWLNKDEANNLFGASIQKRELLAQIKIERFIYVPSQQQDVNLLRDAEKLVSAAEDIVALLPEKEGLQRLGNLHSLRGQIYQIYGDEEGVIQCWQNALACNERAGLKLEAANCHYILGTLYLNRANRDLLANFGTAENLLNQALDYYDLAGMRSQAADTAFMLARLYTNASHQVNSDLRIQMLDAALRLLLHGEASYDAIRREYNAGSTVLEVQQGKRGLIEKSRRIYELALEILCYIRPDAGEVWRWVQRAKARALSDVLGIGSTPPAGILAGLTGSAAELVQQERHLITQINRVEQGERAALRHELAALWETMREIPQLAEYLELRSGQAVDLDDLPALFQAGAPPEAACVLVDWFSVYDDLFLITVRPGSPPAMPERLPLRLSQVQEFLTIHLSPDNFRATLRDDPDLLQTMNGLIAPLARCTHPDELLVFSPTGPINALPLHALEFDGQPLLVRNPIVYCPSMSILRHCMARRRTTSGAVRAALFGDSRGDRAEAANLVKWLAQQVDANLLLGENVTRQAFAQTITGCEIVHFQGHGKHNIPSPLDSHLDFADGRLTAREIFSLTNLQAQLVTLAACESAASQIAPGDEPLGLIPAFLYAGSNTVLATLWKVHQHSAALTMQLFYQKLLSDMGIQDKARMLREAMLTVRQTEGFETIYHWAPYILYGDWA